MTPFKVEIPTPTDSEVKAAVEIIKKAERPVLLLGSQSVLPTTKPADLQKIVKVFLFRQVCILSYLGYRYADVLRRHGQRIVGKGV